MAELKALIEEFDRDMRKILEKEINENFAFRSTKFRAMVEEHGGLETAHRLLKPYEPPPDTFTTLRNMKRLDMTAEYHVVMPKYRSLFSEDEREIAAWRLKYEN